MRMPEATRRQRRAAAVSLAALAGPGLGAAALASWVLAQGMPLCWPRALCGRGCAGRDCALMLGAGLLCWLLALTALGAGGWQWARTARRLSALLRRRSVPGGRLARLLREGGIGGAVAVVHDGAPWALTHGFARPRIAVSSGLVARLSDGELAAVLAHEEHHRRCREPLRVALGRVARAVLWFAPSAGRLLAAYTAAAELAADAYALDRVGRRPLAQALWRLRAAGPQVPAVPFAPTPTLLRRRVEQIERYPEATPGPWPRWTDVLGTAAAVGVAAAWALLCLKG
jgi:Zn-dependent protease with chaperone function